MPTVRLVRIVMLALGTSVLASPAFAQQLKPLPRLVFDVQGFRTSLKADEITAIDLGVLPTALPETAKGFRIDAHLFLMRSANRALGLGFEAVRGGGRAEIVDSTGAVVETLRSRVEGAAGTLSINFGHRDGWSYLSLGAGPMRVETFAGTSPEARPAGRMTANAGAGARWFITRHIAFGFDIRVYLTRASASAPGVAGRRHATLMVLSAGLAVK